MLGGERHRGIGIVNRGDHRIDDGLLGGLDGRLEERIERLVVEEFRPRDRGAGQGVESDFPSLGMGAHAVAQREAFVETGHNAYPGPELRLPDVFSAQLDAFFAAHVRRYMDEEVARSLRITREVNDRRSTWWIRVKQLVAYFVMAVLDPSVSRGLNFGKERE